MDLLGNQNIQLVICPITSMSFNILEHERTGNENRCIWFQDYSIKKSFVIQDYIYSRITEKLKIMA